MVMKVEEEQGSGASASPTALSSPSAIEPASQSRPSGLQSTGAFTPGPHTVVYAEHLGDPAFAVRAADGDLIAVGCLQVDAILFAVAPALLNQLEFAVKLLSGFPTIRGTAQIGAMRDVIAAAKGQVTLSEYAALARGEADNG